MYCSSSGNSVQARLNQLPKRFRESAQHYPDATVIASSPPRARPVRKWDANREAERTGFQNKPPAPENINSVVEDLLRRRDNNDPFDAQNGTSSPPFRSSSVGNLIKKIDVGTQENMTAVEDAHLPITPGVTPINKPSTTSHSFGNKRHIIQYSTIQRTGENTRVDNSVLPSYLNNEQRAYSPSMRLASTGRSLHNRERGSTKKNRFRIPIKRKLASIAQIVSAPNINIRDRRSESGRAMSQFASSSIADYDTVRARFESAMNTDSDDLSNPASCLRRTETAMVNNILEQILLKTIDVTRNCRNYCPDSFAFDRFPHSSTHTFSDRSPSRKDDPIDTHVDSARSCEQDFRQLGISFETDSDDYESENMHPIGDSSADSDTEKSCDSETEILSEYRYDPSQVSTARSVEATKRGLSCMNPVAIECSDNAERQLKETQRDGPDGLLSHDHATGHIKEFLATTSRWKEFELEESGNSEIPGLRNEIVRKGSEGQVEQDEDVYSAACSLSSESIKTRSILSPEACHKSGLPEIAVSNEPQNLRPHSSLLEFACSSSFANSISPFQNSLPRNLEALSNSHTTNGTESVVETYDSGDSFSERGRDDCSKDDAQNGPAGNVGGQQRDLPYSETLSQHNIYESCKVNDIGAIRKFESRRSGSTISDRCSDMLDLPGYGKVDLGMNPFVTRSSVVHSDSE